jgi:NAD(P)-dependent dehydrogenase (short-subunit alcohol dehydrogenase family)
MLPSRLPLQTVLGALLLLPPASLLAQRGTGADATMMSARTPAHAAAHTGQPDLRGKTVLVTGSTDGLGREVATRIASLGAHVIVHGRNADRGREVVEAIAASGRGSAKFYAADFGSIGAVRAFAAELRRDHQRLDMLINNAGVLVPRGEPRRTSADGHELHFAVNYLAGYVLAHELRPLLQAGAPSRIINVASLSQSPILFDDVMLERPGAAARGYAQSKLAQILMTVDMAPELAPLGISIVALHPATLMNTSMVTEGGMRPRSTVDEGADAVMHLVTMPELPSGAYFNGQQRSTPHPQADDADARRRLRELSAQLTGVP